MVHEALCKPILLLDQNGNAHHLPLLIQFPPYYCKWMTVKHQEGANPRHPNIDYHASMNSKGLINRYDDLSPAVTPVNLSS
jgi:hypothetical protein